MKKKHDIHTHSSENLYNVSQEKKKEKKKTKNEKRKSYMNMRIKRI